MFDWNEFIQILKSAKVEFAHLREIQLAQAILESGRGQSDLFKMHGNPYGMKFRKEMRAIADPILYRASDGEDIYCKFDDSEEAVKGYWVFIDRPVYSGWRANNDTPEDFIRFIAYAGYVGGPFNGSDEDRKEKEVYIQKILALLPEAQKNLGISVPPILPTRKIWKAKGVLLEVGHGPNPDGSEFGANGVNGINEYNLNWLAAKSAQEVILNAGVPCTITDFGGFTPRNDLYEIGQTAADYDVFCSIHHNSAGTPAQGAEVLVHNTKGDTADIDLAKLMSAEISAELKIRDRIARGRDPRQALGVLSGAEDTNVRVSVLAELYFIHVPVPDVKDWSNRGGQAVGHAIVKWLEKTLG